MYIIVQQDFLLNKNDFKSCLYHNQKISTGELLKINVKTIIAHDKLLLCNELTVGNKLLTGCTKEK